MIYEIAGLKIEMEPKYGRLARQSESYASSGTPVMRIKAEPDDEAQTALARLSAEEREYICCGASFCRSLIGHGRFFLHASAVVHEGAAYLFSGPSGTGKSTHTNLWHSLYDTPILNGDLNLLAFENRMPVVHGIPWCGTSGICTTETHPLGGIVILRQDREDFVNTLSLDKQILSVTNRMITPNWTHSLFEKNLQFASGLSACIPIVRACFQT